MPPHATRCTAVRHLTHSKYGEPLGCHSVLTRCLAENPKPHTPRAARHHVPIIRLNTALLRHTSRRYSVRGPPLRAAHRAHLCCSMSGDINSGTDQWDRAQLLARQLAVAVSEENYADAARLRDERANLVVRMSPVGQIILKALTKLHTGETFERREAVEQIAELQDRRCLNALFDALHDSDARVAERSEKALWELFCLSGDPEVDSLLNVGMVAMQHSPQLEDAKSIFSEVISMSPSFAEGYNKRATAHYLVQEFTPSIKDCQRTLELEPAHFGALSGMGLCHIALGNHKSALEAFKKAVRVNPRLQQIASYMELEALQELEAMVSDEESESE